MANIPAMITIPGTFGGYGASGEGQFNSGGVGIGAGLTLGGAVGGFDGNGGNSGVGGTNTNEYGTVPCGERSGTAGPGTNAGANCMNYPCQSACQGNGKNPKLGCCPAGTCPCNYAPEPIVPV